MPPKKRVFRHSQEFSGDYVKVDKDSLERFSRARVPRWETTKKTEEEIKER